MRGLLDLLSSRSATCQVPQTDCLEEEALHAKRPKAVRCTVQVFSEVNRYSLAAKRGAPEPCRLLAWMAEEDHNHLTIPSGRHLVVSSGAALAGTELKACRSTRCWTEGSKDRQLDDPDREARSRSSLQG